jgi:hypothetical protein
MIGRSWSLRQFAIAQSLSRSMRHTTRPVRRFWSAVAAASKSQR